MKKFCLLLILTIYVFAAAKTAALTADTLSDTANYLKKTVSSLTVASVGGEWTVIGLSRSGLDIPRGYFDKYVKNASEYVKTKDGVLHSRKYTEYSRVVLALTSIGENPVDFYGYDLVSPLFDYDKVCLQGINGPIWALIALDSGNYGTDEIKEKYISYILSFEKENGGWSLSESEKEPDADVTAMALTALSNHLDDKRAKSAANRAINVLSGMQDENAGYSSYGETTSESASQVLVAISSLGISYNDERFVKNGKTLVDFILSYKQKDGSFAHTDKSDVMATEQCFYALVSAFRLESGKSSLFDMKSGVITVPSVKYPKKTFDDVKGHKNQLSIESLAQRGIINGMSENVFSPDSSMTRAQFATIVVRALGLPMKNVCAFSDVNKTSWYYDYVCTASFYGIIKGVSESLFDPESFISREQALVMISRAAKLCGLENTLSAKDESFVLSAFSDGDNVSDWAKSSVAFCAKAGIFVPEGKKINPSESIKRAEIADVIYKLLKGAKLI